MNAELSLDTFDPPSSLLSIRSEADFVFEAQNDGMPYVVRTFQKKFNLQEMGHQHLRLQEAGLELATVAFVDQPEVIRYARKHKFDAMSASYLDEGYGAFIERSYKKTWTIDQHSFPKWVEEISDGTKNTVLRNLEKAESVFLRLRFSPNTYRPMVATNGNVVWVIHAPANLGVSSSEEILEIFARWKKFFR